MSARAESAGGLFAPSTMAQRMLMLSLVCLIAIMAGAGPNTLSWLARIGGSGQPAAHPPASVSSFVLPEASAAVSRWAASPMILPSPPVIEAPAAAAEPVRAVVDRRSGRAASLTTAEPVMVVAFGATALLGISLFESMIFALLHAAAHRRRVEYRKSAAIAGPAIDYEERARQLFASVTVQWKRAETSVFDLKEALPLRTLLFNELKLISQRLALEPGGQMPTTGAVTVYQGEPYWKLLSQRLQQSARDLQRISAVAEAAGVGFGSQHSEPRIPKTRDEACFILGANRDADADTLQRLVKALRQCWHPDLAQTEQDRGYREARLKQINAAHDLITGKRAEG